MRNAISQNPRDLVFGDKSKLTILIKKDAEYQKVIHLVENEINNGQLSGEIFAGSTPENTVIFNSRDLNTAIHGIKKINYFASKTDSSHYEVDISLYDIYDFDPKANYSLDLKEDLVKLADLAEKLGVLKNFELLIKTHETI